MLPLLGPSVALPQKSCPTCSDAECQYCSSSTNYLCASRPSGYACSLGACDGSGSCQSYPGTCPTCSSCKECSEATNYQCVNKEAGSSCPDGVCDANGTCKVRCWSIMLGVWESRGVWGYVSATVPC